MPDLGAIQPWLDWGLRRIGTRRRYPAYLVRIARYAETAVLLQQALDGPPWSDELVDSTIETILDSGSSEISMFESRTRSLFDPSHGLALIAGTIASGLYSDTKRERYLKNVQDVVESSKKQKNPPTDTFVKKKFASLIMPAEVLNEDELSFTPAGNLHFWPACHLHYDLRPTDHHRVAISILDAIHDGRVAFGLVDRLMYRVFAGVVFAYCVSRFGDLSDAIPPNGWRDLQTSAVEQLDRLRFASGAHGFVSRLPRLA